MPDSWFEDLVLQRMETPSAAPQRTRRGCRGQALEAQQGRPGRVGQVRLRLSGFLFRLKYLYLGGLAG